MNDLTSTNANALTEAPQLTGTALLLHDLRANDDFTRTTEGMRLIMRVEQALLAAEDHGLGRSQITNASAMKAFMDFGEFVSKSSVTLPDHLKGKPADCSAIAMRSERWGLDFFGVAEKTNIVNGKLGYESQLIGAVMKNMGAIKEPLHTEYFGPWEKINGKFVERESKKKMDANGHPVKYKVPAWKAEDEVGLGVHVWTTLTGEREPRRLTLLMTQALVRNSTLWASNPQQQLFYLAQKYWQRMFAPTCMLGAPTVDDLEAMSQTKDMGEADVVGAETNGIAGVPPELLAKWRTESQKGWTASAKFWREVFTQDHRKKIPESLKQEMQSIAQAADKARTVDNGGEAKTTETAKDAGVSGKQTPAGDQQEAPATTATAAADTDGVVDDDFVRALDDAERQGSSTDTAKE